MLRSRDVQTTPALQCIRQWMLRMEVDVSEWRPECLAPLALALRHNDRFMAFKAEGVPLGIVRICEAAEEPFHFANGIFADLMYILLT